MRRRKTLCVDFDGVTHSYTSDWGGPDIAADPPVDGAIAWLGKVARHYNITIHSARLNDPRGEQCVRDYFEKHGLRKEIIDTFTYSPKPHAHLYIDDRAFHFKGTFPTLDEIRSFKPWNK